MSEAGRADTGADTAAAAADAAVGSAGSLLRAARERQGMHIAALAAALKVTPRKPEGTPHGRRLLNGAGIGLLELDDRGRPQRICQLLVDGSEVAFVPREAEARED